MPAPGIDLSQHTPAFRKFYEEEQKREAAKLAKLAAPAQETLRAIHKKCAEAWTHPVEKLTRDLYYVEASTPDLGLPEISEADYARCKDPEIARAVVAEGRSVAAKFIDDLPATTGYILAEPATKKLMYFVTAQTRYQNAELSTAMLLTCFNWLMDNGCFADGDYGYDASVRTVVEHEDARKSLDEILRTTDTRTQAGQDLVKKAVHDAWFEEHRPLVQEFFAYLRKEYSIEVTDEDYKHLFDLNTGWFAVHGKPFGISELNEARRHMASIGRWSGAVTIQEYLDAKFQRGEIDRTAYMYDINRFGRVGKLDRPLKEAQGLI